MPAIEVERNRPGGVRGLVQDRDARVAERLGRFTDLVAGVRAVREVAHNVGDLLEHALAVLSLGGLSRAWVTSRWVTRPMIALTAMKIRPARYWLFG